MGKKQQTIAWVTCDKCQSRAGKFKHLFRTRADARRARKKTKRAGMSVYPCPHYDGFHIGHRPKQVTR